MSPPTGKWGGARVPLSVFSVAVLVSVTAPPEALAQLRLVGQQKQANAVRVAGGEIRVDGRLDEVVWSRAQPLTDFIQKEPAEGAAPSERTEVRFVYDENGLYVGARMSSSGGRPESKPLWASETHPTAPTGAAGPRLSAWLGLQW